MGFGIFVPVLKGMNFDNLFIV